MRGRPYRLLGRDRRGTSAIEFALIAPVLALMTMGIADLAMGLARKFQIEQASYRVLEMVTVGTLRDDYSDVEAEAEAAAPGAEVNVDWWLECDGAKEEIFTTQCPTDKQTARYVRVELLEDYEPMFNYGPIGRAFSGNVDGKVRLTARSTVRIQ